MLILYRLSPHLSVNPNPLGGDKSSIIETCFKSFKKANNGSRIIIINDGCSSNTLEGYETIGGAGGNIPTFHQQLDYATTLQDEEKVFFVEDDYLWVEGAISKIERSLDELEIVSPYDHPGHYFEERFKNEPKLMRLIDNQTYREAPSNTLTFATKAGLIKKNLDLIKPFGIRDHELFQALPYKMWCAVPSLATHLVVGLLAPNVNWNI